MYVTRLDDMSSKQANDHASPSWLLISNLTSHICGADPHTEAANVDI